MTAIGVAADLGIAILTQFATIVFLLGAGPARQAGILATLGGAAELALAVAWVAYVARSAKAVA